MKQVVQNLRSGDLELLEVPCPRVSPRHLLIQTRATVISAGTERMLVEFGRAGMISKARQQPEKVRQVFDKVKADGLLPTLEAVFFKLEEPMPLGYCNAGVVIEAGSDVRQFAVGDRVVSNGPHAEVVHRPENLCAKIPDSVSDEHAAFAILGAIGLQGIRLLHLELGESVAVFGLGLIGLISVQILVQSGFRVLAIDPDASRLQLAKQFGATVVDLSTGSDQVASADAFTAGRGVDAVLITASAKDDDIVSLSARMSRQRGRIVLVGSVDLELNRSDFYEKELTFQVSCSYGPGRYDPVYEEQGIDYPYAFVRWTERRNIEAVLEMMAAGRLNVAPLVTDYLPNGEAKQAYDKLVSDRSQLGIVLTYPKVEPPRQRIVAVTDAGKGGQQRATEKAGADNVRIGIIGAGTFATRVLLPALRKTPAMLRSIASAGGISAAHAARKFGIESCTTDARAIIDDPNINTIVVATRHDSHARLAVQALHAGKHVFVEKPLAIDGEGLDEVVEAYEQSNGLQLAVGFNRRFSPHGKKIRELLRGRAGPAALTMIVNAGKLPEDHWLLDPHVGGGRMIGEGCHWLDFMSFVLAQPIVDVSAASMGNGAAGRRAESISATMRFGDGSLGTLQYFADGHRAFPKERMTVFCDGKALELDNFRRLIGWGWPNFRRMNLFRQDKGHAAEMAEFVNRVADGGPPLIPLAEMVNVTESSFKAAH